MNIRRGALASFFPRRFGEWVGPLVAAGFALALIAVVAAMSGWIDLAASTPHPQGWANLLHFVFRRSTAAHSRSIVVPQNIDSPRMVAKGLTYYQRGCAHCHGAPGLGQNPIALSMRPQPPYLVKDRAGLDAAGVFRVVKHGIKYSAMPAWPAQQRDDEIWSLVAVVRQLPTMRADTYRRLAYPDAADLRAGSLAPSLAPKDTRHAYPMPILANPGIAAYGNFAPATGFEGGMGGDPIMNCVQCHGADGAGRGSGGFPNIALLDPAYMRRALLQYRSGVRVSGFMQPVAVELSDAEIVALSTYYARQPKRRSANFRAPRELLVLGQSIAERGDANRGIGACANCHGEAGASKKGFSTLDGQYPAYLRDQLRLFRSTVRGGRDTANQMTRAARSLTDREIVAVSLFYGSRGPGSGRVVADNAAPKVAPSTRFQERTAVDQHGIR